MPEHYRSEATFFTEPPPHLESLVFTTAYQDFYDDSRFQELHILIPSLRDISWYANTSWPYKDRDFEAFFQSPEGIQFTGIPGLRVLSSTGNEVTLSAGGKSPVLHFRYVDEKWGAWPKSSFGPTIHEQAHRYTEKEIAALEKSEYYFGRCYAPF
jgi:hypothetical protein